MLPPPNESNRRWRVFVFARVNGYVDIAADTAEHAMDVAEHLQPGQCDWSEPKEIIADEAVPIEDVQD